MVDKLRDNRRNGFFTVDNEIDDIGLSLEAYRVYGHLCRRCGGKNDCYPGYQSIGNICFPALSKDRRKKKAIKAVDELISLTIVLKRKRTNQKGTQSSNEYLLLDKSEWKRPTGQENNTGSYLTPVPNMTPQRKHT